MSNALRKIQVFKTSQVLLREENARLREVVKMQNEELIGVKRVFELSPLYRNIACINSPLSEAIRAGKEALNEK